MNDFTKAMKKLADVAMGDLIGSSEPPPGSAESYPFNAVRWVDTLPAEWQAHGHWVVGQVYLTDRRPDFSSYP